MVGVDGNTSLPANVDGVTGGNTMRELASHTADKMQMLIYWLSLLNVRCLNTFSENGKLAGDTELWTKGRGQPEKLWSQIDYLGASLNIKGNGRPLLSTGKQFHDGVKGSDHRPVSGLLSFPETNIFQQRGKRSLKSWAPSDHHARIHFHDLCKSSIQQIASIEEVESWVSDIGTSIEYTTGSSRVGQSRLGESEDQQNAYTEFR